MQEEERPEEVPLQEEERQYRIQCQWIKVEYLNESDSEVKEKRHPVRQPGGELR